MHQSGLTDDLKVTAKPATLTDTWEQYKGYAPLSATAKLRSFYAARENVNLARYPKLAMIRNIKSVETSLVLRLRIAVIRERDVRASLATWV